MRRDIKPIMTGVERHFGKDEIIVTKTDPKGKIIYGNEVFMRLAGYSEDEVIGKPHNIIRHPAMPRCVFKLLWDTIGSGKEIFAYVINLAKTGDHYWVLAHVTPTFGPDGRIQSYHSSRRCPSRDAIAKIEPVYKTLCGIEISHQNPQDGMDASFKALLSTLGSTPYEEFVFSL